MFRRPSVKRQQHSQQIELNLVPILDTMVTLIGFLLFTMSFIAFVSIDSPAPIASTQENEKQLTEKPLQLTLTIRDKECELWSPFDKIKAQQIPHGGDGTPDARKVHEALIELKKSFPQERKIVLVPHSGLNYDHLVALMDAARTLEPTDPPLFSANPTTGVQEAQKSLFPEIIFGNLLGDAG